MKKYMVGLIVCVLITGQIVLGYDVEVRQAFGDALDDMSESLEKAQIPDGKTVAVLPLWGDKDGIVEGLLKNAITDAGLTCVEGKTDPFWDDVLEQVEWDERKADMLDPSTLTKFGKLKAAQLLVYGTVRQADRTGQRVFVEIELHISSIETKEHVWGQVFARRFYLPGETVGIVDIDDDVREILKSAFNDGLTSLKRSQKLGKIKTVALVPLAGDIDGYAESLAEGMISQTTMMTKDLDVGTLAEARLLMRDRPSQADAVMYGAVRDLSRKTERRDFMKTTYEVSGEVQLKIQDASTGDVLWSDTLSSKKMIEENMTVWELVTLKPKVSLGILVGVVGFLILSSFFRKMRRSR